ncbi:MAG: DUF1952 domain-containing protein [Oscillochloridaceae bacterium umkhey_bin13]
MLQFTTIDLDAPLRGVSVWLIREYLQDLGGSVQDEATVLGTGWRAELHQLEPFRVGSLRVGQVQLILSGDPEPLAVLREALTRKLMTRGGG